MILSLVCEWAEMERQIVEIDDAEDWALPRARALFMYLLYFISDLQACQISVIMADKRDSNWSSAEVSTTLAVHI
jgi:hypothetical protein